MQSGKFCSEVFAVRLCGYQDRYLPRASFPILTTQFRGENALQQVSSYRGLKPFHNL